MQLKLLDFKEYDALSNQIQGTMQNTSLMNDWSDSIENQQNHHHHQHANNQKSVREDKSLSKSAKKNLLFQPKLFSSHSSNSHSQSKLEDHTNYTLAEEYLHMSGKQNISMNGTNNETKMNKKKNFIVDKKETYKKQIDEFDEKLQQIFDTLNSLIKKGK